MRPRDCTFRRYKVHADIRGDSVARGLKRSCGGQNRLFLVISVAISSEPFELKPVLLFGVMKCLISAPVTPKCLTLNDTEVSFYAM